MSVLKMSEFLRLEEETQVLVDKLIDDKIVESLDSAAEYADNLIETGNEFDIEVAATLLERAEKLFEGESELFEKIVKKVSVTDRKAGGKLITKQKDRKTRARKATQTTGLSKAQRRKTARKAAKTMKRDVSGQKKAAKKRKKSMKKRDQMGL